MVSVRSRYMPSAVMPRPITAGDPVIDAPRNGRFTADTGLLRAPAKGVPTAGQSRTRSCGAWVLATRSRAG